MRFYLSRDMLFVCGHLLDPQMQYPNLRHCSLHGHVSCGLHSHKEQHLHDVVTEVSVDVIILGIHFYLCYQIVYVCRIAPKYKTKYLTNHPYNFV